LEGNPRPTEMHYTVTGRGELAFVAKRKKSDLWGLPAYKPLVGGKKGEGRAKMVFRKKGLKKGGNQGGLGSPEMWTLPIRFGQRGGKPKRVGGEGEDGEKGEGGPFSWENQAKGKKEQRATERDVSASPTATPRAVDTVNVMPGGLGRLER